MKNLLLALLLIASPVFGRPVSVGTSSDIHDCDAIYVALNPVSNATRYVRLSLQGIQSAAESDVDRLMLPIDSRLHSLRVHVDNNVTAGSWTVTVSDDGTGDTSLACAITSGKDCTDITNRPTEGGGSKLTVKVVGSSTVNQASEMLISFCVAPS